MNPPAVEWMQNVSISDSDKVKILSENAKRLLKM
jgi:predicted TIM-barrel fold metal-dependent hydrolase